MCCLLQEYSILDESELRRSMDALTKDVATVLHVPQHLASMLLRTHKSVDGQWAAEHCGVAAHTNASSGSVTECRCCVTDVTAAQQLEQREIRIAVF
jgi:hypothetical protein